MDSQSQGPSFVNDLFISYSRKDIDFARALEKALTNYYPPKDLNVPKRRLAVFRDEVDFTGVEYNQSLRKHLENSYKMLVICSPDARASSFVNEEIRLFAELRGAENIIPVLRSGIPNNEASSHEHENLKAFPQRLTDIMPMPLAASFLNFGLSENKPNRGTCEGPWHTILANFYGISRSDVEQRERKRKNRQIWMLTAIVAGIIVLLSIALIIALIQRSNAIEAELKTKDQLRKYYWSNILDSQANDDWLSLLHYSAKAGELATNQLIAKNALHNIYEHTTIFLTIILKHNDSVSGVLFIKAETRILTWSADGTARLWNASDGSPIGQPMKHDSAVNGAAYNQDETRILTWSEDGTARLWDASDGSPIGQPMKHDRSVNGAVYNQVRPGF